MNSADDDCLLSFFSVFPGRVGSVQFYPSSGTYDDIRTTSTQFFFSSYFLYPGTHAYAQPDPVDELDTSSYHLGHPIFAFPLDRVYPSQLEREEQQQRAVIQHSH